MKRSSNVNKMPCSVSESTEGRLLSKLDHYISRRANSIAFQI